MSGTTRNILFNLKKIFFFSNISHITTRIETQTKPNRRDKNQQKCDRQSATHNMWLPLPVSLPVSLPVRPSLRLPMPLLPASQWAEGGRIRASCLPPNHRHPSAHCAGLPRCQFPSLPPPSPPFCLSVCVSDFACLCPPPHCLFSCHRFTPSADLGSPQFESGPC